ncbi:MAG: transposase, partial [Terrimicrobiaceae bacterium]
MLGEIGSDRARFDDFSTLQCLAGTAPLSYQSGQIHKVYLRRHCNKSLRSAVHLWTNLTRKCAITIAAVFPEPQLAEDQNAYHHGRDDACKIGNQARGYRVTG